MTNMNLIVSKYPKKIWIIIGTRPEAIKLFPVVQALKAFDWLDVTVCLTGQHREMVHQAMQALDFSYDLDFELMRPRQTLGELTANIVQTLADIFEKQQPGLVVVQGDTTTTFASSLAAFYNRILVAHVEAGLRTHNKWNPFPEEINRRMTSSLADLHFAPTETAKNALLREDIPECRIWVTGNTVVDAILYMAAKVQANNSLHLSFLDKSKKLILVTGHRRESFGESFKQICRALKIIAQSHNDVQIVYPVHLNPNVREPVYSILANTENITLIEPLDYKSFVFLMTQAYIILTDSGGIQEEAPALKKPVLVMRETTERPEGIEAGIARLVGTKTNQIVENVELLIQNQEMYNAMASGRNPYGDGMAGQRIADVIGNFIQQ